MTKFLKYDDMEEVDHTIKRILDWVKLKSYGTAYNDLWYAGITGQEDEDEDGRADRFVAHKNTYPKIVEDSWSQWEVSCTEVAIEIEKRLHALDFDGEGEDGRPGNLSLEPNIVYVFIHGNK